MKWEVFLLQCCELMPSCKYEDWQYLEKKMLSLNGMLRNYDSTFFCVQTIVNNVVGGKSLEY
ncbi:hypothetical protein HanHA300_Chr13g0497961 [Helianthus annuus]|nr:hypothetical protein HanHA300_Chr13g0497961 [Helianthus annuus]KAJ0499117.1 hypothetical protein HanHA89_Chr13g0530631 [Helianthus annuus]KAJ0665131.1 hypothetical protein HanLR1_Chr13g0500661 [Helianthus annuus]